MSQHDMQQFPTLSEAARLMEAVPETDETIEAIVRAALDTVPGFDHAGISVTAPGGSIETRAATHQFVRDLDRLQSQLHEGPGFDSTRTSGVTVVQHARHDPRWPRYMPEAARRGLRAQLTVRLYSAADSVADLNFYSTQTDAIDDHAIGTTELFASQAAMALGRSRDMSELGTALESRRLIGLALGLVMERYDVDEQRAFHFLVRTSSTRNIGLREVAVELLRTADERATRRSTSITTPGGNPRAPQDASDVIADVDTAGVLRHLSRSAALARALSPDLAGFTLASHAHGVIFTVVATDDEVASLDAVQYLAGGPCVESVDTPDVATTSAVLHDQPQSPALAQAAVAVGVRCVLTLPVVRGQERIGTVNLYGRTDNTFDDKHALLTTIFDSWAPRAIADARLSSVTRELTDQAATPPDRGTVERATDVLASAAGVDTDLARALIEGAAALAGAPVPTLARLLADLPLEVRGPVTAAP